MIVDGNEVSLAHRNEFSEHLRISKANYFDEVRMDSAPRTSKPKVGRLAAAAAARMSTLWAPVA